jgi:hypothetical protein
LELLLVLLLQQLGMAALAEPQQQQVRAGLA